MEQKLENCAAKGYNEVQDTKKKNVQSTIKATTMCDIWCNNVQQWYNACPEAVDIPFLPTPSTPPPPQL